jgi:hypothetical protein
VICPPPEKNPLLCCRKQGLGNGNGVDAANWICTMWWHGGVTSIDSEYVHEGRPKMSQRSPKSLTDGRMAKGAFSQGALPTPYALRHLAIGGEVLNARLRWRIGFEPSFPVGSWRTICTVKGHDGSSVETWFSILVGLAGGRIKYVHAVWRCTARFTCLKASSPSPIVFAPAEDKAERAVPAEQEEKRSRGCLVALLL